MNGFTSGLLQQLAQQGNKTRLIAVSKYQPISRIEELYNHGLRHFGESRVEELVKKAEALPKDIVWHFIGHLQTNKVKKLLPLVQWIHSIDSISLLEKVETMAQALSTTVSVLLQIHIAQETHKFGFYPDELNEYLSTHRHQALQHVKIKGVMGMATFTDNTEQITAEFRSLHHLMNKLKNDYFKDTPDFQECSMGMSNDYSIALAEGSTMLRIGHAIFEEEN